MRTREATQRERTRILDQGLVPTWGNRPAADITRREVVHLAARGKSPSCSRCMSELDSR